MNEELSALTSASEKLILLAQMLEQRSEASIQEQVRAGQALNQAVATARQDVNQLVQGANTQIAQLVKHAVDSALHQSTADYEQRIHSSTVKIDSAGKNVEHVLQETSGFVHSQIWLAYGAILGAMVLLIAGGGLLMWWQTQAYNEARARTASAQVDAETMEAFNQVGVTSCGGHPCMKLDTKSPRWGDKNQYVLISTASKQKAN
jgi:hypothetical protein